MRLTSLTIAANLIIRLEDLYISGHVTDLRMPLHAGPGVYVNKCKLNI
jgi:hypothetical protein